MSGENPAFPWTTHTPWPPVLYVWLHLPTGAAGASTIWALPSGAPTAGAGHRLLPPDTPVPGETGGPWSPRRTGDVDRVLAEHGWRAARRGEARRALSTRFGLVREDGLLEAVQGQETVWQPSEFGAVAFALRAGPGLGPELGGRA